MLALCVATTAELCVRVMAGRLRESLRHAGTVALCVTTTAGRSTAARVTEQGGLELLRFWLEMSVNIN